MQQAIDKAIDKARDKARDKAAKVAEVEANAATDQIFKEKAAGLALIYPDLL
jgi:hypothetical protein